MSDRFVALGANNWAIVDGMGRTRVSLSEADVSAGDGGEWIANEIAHYDAKGAVRAKHLDFFWGSGGSTPVSFPIENLPNAPQATQRFDAFGRSVESRDLDGTATLTSLPAKPVITAVHGSSEKRVGFALIPSDRRLDFDRGSIRMVLASHDVLSLSPEPSARSKDGLKFGT